MSTRTDEVKEPKKKEFKPAFVLPNDLKNLTSDQLLQLTQTKMVGYLEKQEPKILDV